MSQPSATKSFPSALYVWLVRSEEVLDQPGSWRIRKWDTEPFPEANFTVSETAMPGVITCECGVTVKERCPQPGAWSGCPKRGCTWPKCGCKTKCPGEATPSATRSNVGTMSPDCKVTVERLGDTPSATVTKDAERFCALADSGHALAFLMFLVDHLSDDCDDMTVREIIDAKLLQPRYVQPRPVCGACNGTGEIPASLTTCQTCAGSGETK